MVKKTESKWQPLNPDMVMFNGNIITVDDNFSIAGAVAIKDEKITGIGSNEDMKKLAGGNTRLLDLKRSYSPAGDKRCPLPP